MRKRNFKVGTIVGRKGIAPDRGTTGQGITKVCKRKSGSGHSVARKKILVNLIFSFERMEVGVTRNKSNGQDGEEAEGICHGSKDKQCYLETLTV